MRWIQAHEMAVKFKKGHRVLARVRASSSSQNHRLRQVTSGASSWCSMERILRSVWF